MTRTCGTCLYARDEGRGRTVCTHDGGHHCTVITTPCKARGWWRERKEPITLPSQELAGVVEDGGQMRLAMPEGGQIVWQL